MDAQKVFKSTFNALINECHLTVVDIHKYQSVLEHKLSREVFSVGTGIYILPSRCNSKILVSNTGIIIGPNKDVKKTEVYYQKPRSPEASSKAHAAPEIFSMKRSTSQ